MTTRHADGWLPIWLPVERMAGEVRALRQTAVQAGRDLGALTVRSPAAIVVTRDVERARQAARGTRASFVARMAVFYHQHIARLGSADEAAAIRRAWDSIAVRF